MIGALPPDPATVRKEVAVYRRREATITWAAEAERTRLEYADLLAMYRHLEITARRSPFIPSFPSPYLKGFSVASNNGTNTSECSCGEPLDSHKCTSCGGCWVKCGCP